MVDDGRMHIRHTTDGRWFDGYTISSPCEPNGSGELKRQHLFFRQSRAANSVVRGRNWLNFKLIQALMYVIITCKYEKDLIKIRCNVTNL